jgi:AcrR family transcriptional regulator
LTFRYQWYQNTVGMQKRPTRAEKRERTYEELISAAEKLFVEQGFHATSVDEIAFEAGYTKGAVYSNFGSKEDLFFAVYERTAERAVEEADRVIGEWGPATGLERLAYDSALRRGRDDGWLAVFFEFWAHVVRHPELRERFGKVHTRALAPFVAATERLERGGVRLPANAPGFNAAMFAMVSALTLERLTRPDVVDAELGARMIHFVTEASLRDEREEG